MYFVIYAAVVLILVLTKVLSVHGAWLLGIPCFLICFAVGSFIRLVGFVGEKGYFSGKRTNIRWWYAMKEIGNPTGVEIKLREGNAPELKGKKIFEDEYYGELPESATSEGLSKWLISQGFKGRKYDRFGIHLIFPESINIGEIATGFVKSTIDCLWPIIGGKEGAPEDWRVEELVVEKKSGYNLKLEIRGFKEVYT